MQAKFPYGANIFAKLLVFSFWHIKLHLCTNQQWTQGRFTLVMQCVTNAKQKVTKLIS